MVCFQIDKSAALDCIKNLVICVSQIRQNAYFFVLFLFTFHSSIFNVNAADGWPSQYKGVMLQAFYWDSFDDTNWTILEKQAEELGQYFSLVWLPQSANCGGQSMGYDDLYWFTNYNSSFGTEAELRSLIKAFKNNGIATIAEPFSAAQ